MSDSNTLSLPSMHSNWDGGSVARISRLSGFSRPTIYRGVDSLTNYRRPLSEYVILELDERRWSKTPPPNSVAEVLEALIDPDTRSYPMSPLRWTWARVPVNWPAC